jgi:hypothetical protein
VISGWVYHPTVPLSEVSLCLGPHRIAAAPIDVHRSDVEEHLGIPGCFAFDLRIPADLPLLELTADPVVLAIAADGLQSWPLRLMREAEATTLRLQVALRQDYRGLRGHCDGLSPEGQSVHGWCYRLGSAEHASLWLQVEGLPPRPLTADQLRPGFSQAGHPERCGFRYWLKDWPEAAGRQLWFSFDRKGELPLPLVGTLRAPEQPAPLPLTLAEPAVSMPARPAARPGDRPIPQQLQDHWQSLEDFRQLIDQLEQQLTQPLPPSGDAQPPLPRSRRSARFRLWR